MAIEVTVLILHVDSITLTPIRSNHTVECCGYLIEKDGSGVLYSHDTYKNDRLWDILNSSLHVKVLIVNISFPLRMTELARQSKHLTPSLLRGEIEKEIKGICLTR